MNRKGYTLLEVMISVLIFAIVSVLIGNLFVSSVMSFRASNTSVEIQKKAQIVSNQFETIILDADLGVSYEARMDDNPNFVTSTAGDTDLYKILYVFNYNESATSEDDIMKVLIMAYSADSDKIFYTEKMIGKDTDIGRIVSISEIPTWNLLSDNILNFNVNMSEYDTRQKISISFETDMNGKSYPMNKDLVLRNSILINADSSEELFNNISRIIKSEVSEIELVSTSSTSKGRTIDIRYFVKALIGYVSQDIHKWEIYRVTDGVETLAWESGTACTLSGDELCISNSVSTGHVSLYIPESESSTLIRVYAYVNTHVEPAADYICASNEKIMTSNIGLERIFKFGSRDIALKTYDDFLISIDLQKELPENSELNDVVAPTLSYSGVREATMPIYPGNKIKVEQILSGYNLDEADKEINIETDDSSGYSSYQDGQISIRSDAPKGIITYTFKPQQNSSMALTLKLDVKSTIETGSTVLEIEAPNTMNRGLNHQIELYKFNGVTREKIDDRSLTTYNWSIESVKNSSGVEIKNAPVNVSSSGFLSIGNDIPFDYEYRIKLKVVWRNDSDFWAEKEIVIPRVSVSIAPSSIKAKRGDTIPEGIITANVTGLENYSLNWNIASETNPNYYNTFFSSGTNVQGKKNTAAIYISDSESSSVSYIKLRATLSNNTRFSSTSYILLKTTSLSLSPSDTTVERNASMPFSVSSNMIPGTLSYSSIAYKITANLSGVETVVYDNVHGVSNGVTITDRLTSTPKISVSDNFYLSSSDITLTLTATLGDAMESFSVKVPKISFEMSGNSKMKRGETLDLYLNNAYGQSPKWTTNIADKGGVNVIDATHVQIYLDKDYNLGNVNNTITVTARLGTSDIVATKVINVEEVKINVNVNSVAKNRFNINTSTTGIDSSTVVWGLTTTQGVASNLKTLNGAVIKNEGGTSTSVDMSTSTNDYVYLYTAAAVDVDGNIKTFGGSGEKWTLISKQKPKPYSVVSGWSGWSNTVNINKPFGYTETQKDCKVITYKDNYMVINDDQSISNTTNLDKATCFSLNDDRIQGNGRYLAAGRKKLYTSDIGFDWIIKDSSISFKSDGRKYYVSYSNGSWSISRTSDKKGHFEDEVISNSYNAELITTLKRQTVDNFLYYKIDIVRTDANLNITNSSHYLVEDEGVLYAILPSGTVELDSSSSFSIWGYSGSLGNLKITNFINDYA